MHHHHKTCEQPEQCEQQREFFAASSMHAPQKEQEEQLQQQEKSEASAVCAQSAAGGLSLTQAGPEFISGPMSLFTCITDSSMIEVMLVAPIYICVNICIQTPFTYGRSLILIVRISPSHLCAFSH
jgi:hypothetical protein